MTDWKTDKALRGRYDKFNRKYFGNRLPKGKQVLVIWRKPFIAGHGAELCFPFEKNQPLVLVNPILKKIGAENYSIQSLLHEMCHLHLWVQGKSYKGHGWLFQNEMKRVANLGALRGIW